MRGPDDRGPRSDAPPGPPTAVDLASAPTAVIEETIRAEPPSGLLASAGTLLAEGGPVTFPEGQDEDADDPAPPVGALDRAGARIGRYEVTGRLGSGGMGVVYRARDPELDRLLAIKVLRGERREFRDEARFLREAQAMARLSHPNVVPVHDVGQSEHGLFLAMELVEGTTLRRWLAEAPRSWREILEIYLQAGRGLAEAHAAGLVHRDFKPENVLVDRRGRARVTDFGLARPEARDGRGALRSLRIGDSALTRSGTIMGTPAYMAPEQLAGRHVDARADLFAFCVALHEALFGRLPYGGSTIGERLTAISGGKLDQAPRGGVPRWLTRALVRGLAAEADARWPDMPALLGALERGLSRRRSLWLAGAGLPLVGALAAAIAAGDDPVDCRAEGALAGVWGPGEAAAVEAAIRGSGLVYAEETWSKVHEQIDRYARAWVDLRRRSCEEHQAGAITGDLLDRRALCLDRRRGDLGLVIDALRQGDRAAVERAIDLVGAVEPVEGCRDPEGSTQSPADVDLAHAAWAEDVRLRLGRARLLERTARHDEALALADAIDAEARSLGDEPARLAALLQRARVESALGQHEVAERHLIEGGEAAHAGGHDRLTAEAAAFLIFVAGEARAHYHAGEAWARIALASARRIGDPREEASARNFYGVMLSSADRLDEARAELERALAIRRELLGADHIETSGSATSLGNVLWKSGRLEEAVSLQRSSLASREAALGANHPALAIPLGNLGVALTSLGRDDEARVAWTRALALIRANYPANHPNIAVISANLAGLESAAGDHAAARDHLLAAIAVAREALGEHPDTALMLQALAGAQIALGDLAGADAAIEEALAMTAHTVGDDHSNAAAIRVTLAELRRAQGRGDEARAELARALALAERAFGPDHARVAEVLAAIADEAEARRDFPAAIAALERAVAIAGRGDASARERGRLHFALARALAGAEPSTWTDHLSRAEAAAREAGGSGEALLAEIDAWRRSRG